MAEKSLVETRGKELIQILEDEICKKIFPNSAPPEYTNFINELNEYQTKISADKLDEITAKNIRDILESGRMMLNDVLYTPVQNEFDMNTKLLVDAKLSYQKKGTSAAVSKILQIPPIIANIELPDFTKKFDEFLKTISNEFNRLNPKKLNFTNPISAMKKKIDQYQYVYSVHIALCKYTNAIDSFLKTFVIPVAQKLKASDCLDSVKYWYA